MSDIQKPEDVAPPEEKRFKPDDDRLARDLAKSWNGKMAYFYSDWHEQRNGVWTRRPAERVNVEARKFMRAKRGTGWDIKITRGLVTSVVSLAADDCYVDDYDVDQGDQYINLENGLFNVNSFQLEPHRPELYHTTQLNFPYDPDADFSTWLRYLKSSLVEGDGSPDWQLIKLLQEALGYSLTADTSMKASFWLVGKPDSGKSTLVAFIRSMMGSLHSTIDLNQLAANRFMLSNIAGKRAVTFTEARVNSVLPDDIFKSIVGGSDEIFADVKNKPGITFVPKAKFWWAMNDMPRVTDRSGAVYNRLHAIPFNRTVPPDQRIANLGELLAQEKAGVFAWAMVGLRRLRNAGTWTASQQSQRVREEYKLINDTEQTYINERAEVDAGSCVQADTLYHSYRQWCIDNGFTPKNSNQVARDWERLGLQRRMAKGKRYWYGIRLESL